MPNLRVIGGSARGRRLKSVPGDSTRPITDRVKEAVFNIVAPDIANSAWFDLFAGTGAVGIEALSRGAAFVRFTDKAQPAVKTIRSNLETIGFSDKAEIWQKDAFSLLAGQADRPFDYVYIAPPQYKEMWKQALNLVDENTGWLVDDAWVIVQIHPVEYSTLLLKNLVEFDQRKYGSTLLVFYERKTSTK